MTIRHDLTSRRLLALLAALSMLFAVFAAGSASAEEDGDYTLQSAGPEPSLVKDIHPGTVGPYPYNSSPNFLTDVDGMLFFIANDGANGNELWRSDGTAAGTVLVKDIYPGPEGSRSVFLTDVDGTLYFEADDAITGDELWKSDGTAAGTVLVKDIWPGEVGPEPAGSAPENLTDVDGTLFFVANDGANGNELWKSDGTAAGTVLVKDIFPGALGRIAFGSNPNFLTDVDGTLFFSAIGRTTGDELWRSDGTAAGTVLVKDIYPGPEGSRSVFLTDVDGTLFFVAYEGTIGFELWKSDGTEAGTVLIKDIWPGMFGSIPLSSAPANLTDVDGTLYFQCNDGIHGDELWKSDGTEAGTVLIKDINPGMLGPDPAGSSPENLTDVDGTLFFIANDGTNGYELWKSDGTEAGTVLIKDIKPGASGSFPSSLTNVDGTLFFIAADGANGYELWKSDGTAAGTVLVKDIYPGAIGSIPSSLTNVDGTLFFSAADDTTGNELWEFDPDPDDLPSVGLVDPSTGLWRLRNGGVESEFYYGDPGDYPFVGDWNCNGVDTPGLYRQSDGLAYLRNSNSQGVADLTFFFGNPGDVPIAGDFNGDGCDTLSIYRPSEARFYIINQLGENEGGLGAAEYSFLFGNPGDKPVVGDWDGDGIDEIGLHRETTGFFYYRNTLTTGIADGQFFFGDPGDRFVSGDWGVVDGVDTPAMFRPSNSTFYFRHTLTQGNADSQFVWPGAGMNWLPVSGEFTLD